MHDLVNSTISNQLEQRELVTYLTPTL